MRPTTIIRSIANILLLNGAFMSVCLIVSLVQMDDAIPGLLFSTLVSVILGVFPLIYIPRFKYLSSSEGIQVVVFGWLGTCLIGALPFFLYGGEFTFINSLFESVSGYTTTGSSILTDIEVLPRSILLWRSTTHWIGGIGIIVFALLIMPFSRHSKMILVKTEISEVAQRSFHFKAGETLRILLYIYVGLTLLETILLHLAGMTWFDAVNHSFATVATGGFSTKNQSVAYFDSFTIEAIIAVFMFLSGLHFGLLFGTVTGKNNNIFHSEVVRLFFLFLAGGVVLVALKLYLTGSYDISGSLRHSLFQVVSLGTTTGFATVDTAHWPFFTQLVLIYFTLQCACVGSTSGGLKFDRMLVFFKSLKNYLIRIRHPNAITVIRINKQTVTEEMERNIILFILIYLFIFFLNSLLLSAMGIDHITSFSASAATLGNVGPGFGQVSSLGNFGGLPAGAKILLMINMIFGRLEIFNLITVVYLFRKG